MGWAFYVDLLGLLNFRVARYPGTAARSSGRLSRNGKGRTGSPLHDSHYFHFDQALPKSFHATSDTRAAARRNLVTAGVEDLERNYIGEFVAVVIDLDDPREPMRLYPGSSGAKNEGLGYCAIRVAVGVLPDTQNCSA